MRKDHAWIDARIRGGGSSAAVELQFYYDGTMVFARTWTSREAALAEAEAQRQDFQRAGWNPHW